MCSNRTLPLRRNRNPYARACARADDRDSTACCNTPQREVPRDTTERTYRARCSLRRARYVCATMRTLRCARHGNPAPALCARIWHHRAVATFGKRRVLCAGIGPSAPDWHQPSGGDLRRGRTSRRRRPNPRKLGFSGELVRSAPSRARLRPAHIATVKWTGLGVAAFGVVGCVMKMRHRPSRPSSRQDQTGEQRSESA